MRRYSLPSFKEILLSISRVWVEDQAEVDRVGERVTAHLELAAEGAGVGVLSQELLDAVTKSMLDSYDWGYGGWGEAPKFPQPMSIEFLLRRGLTTAPLHEEALKAALHALKAMARGGIYDVVGGGFARYSTDNFWHIPHFEKMLYDNALLGRAYLHAWQITREPFYKQIVTETLDFVSTEMTHSGGGFFSSLDADSDGTEGAFYLWSGDEIKEALTQKYDRELFTAAYAQKNSGNWESKTILQRVLDNETLSIDFKMDK